MAPNTIVWRNVYNEKIHTLGRETAKEDAKVVRKNSYSYSRVIRPCLGGRVYHYCIEITSIEPSLNEHYGNPFRYQELGIVNIIVTKTSQVPAKTCFTG